MFRIWAGAVLGGFLGVVAAIPIVMLIGTFWIPAFPPFDEPDYAIMVFFSLLAVGWTIGAIWGGCTEARRARLERRHEQEVLRRKAQARDETAFRRGVPSQSQVK